MSDSIQRSLSLQESIDDDLESLSYSTRSIMDPIHGYITLSSDAWSFIDTKQFQRLRYIKQLGTSYYVWPGAAHNRFEHCIGVAHLARLMVDGLRRRQPSLGITDRDVKCVELAGLCHDLGHGPFSHVWDSHFIPRALPGLNWCHEDASEMMLQDLVDSNDIDVSQDDVDFIKDLIKGVPNHTKNKNPPEKSFLFDIVANKRNGLDVDKFDYIPRDHHAVGHHANVGVERLISSARVIDDQICFISKDANVVYELCYTRFSNHKSIYNHKTAKAIEFMIVDALILAEPVMKFAADIRNSKKFVYLTDDILLRIERSEEPELAKSRAVLDRIRTRKLYTAVDYKSLGWSVAKRVQQQLTPALILQAVKSLYEKENTVSMPNSNAKDTDDLVRSLKEEDIIVDFAYMHYGMQERNPMDFVKFYGKHSINKAGEADPSEYSTVVPSTFAEALLRIYTKDKRYYGIVQAGYRKVMKELHENDIAESPTPEPPFSSQSTMAVPSTPKISATESGMHNGGNGSAVIATPAPVTINRQNRADNTPFTENKFTVVPMSFRGSRSPTSRKKQKLKRAAGGDSFASGTTAVSNFSLDGIPHMEEDVKASDNGKRSPSPALHVTQLHTLDEGRQPVEIDSESARPKALTPYSIPVTPLLANAVQAGDDDVLPPGPSRPNPVEVPESPTRGRRAVRKREHDSPSGEGKSKKRSRLAGGR